MQVCVHEQEGKSLALLITGASHESVVDAFWNGLKRPVSGVILAIGQAVVSGRQNGAVLLRCEMNDNVTAEAIRKEMEFQLTHYAVKASA